jgi:acyl carrier protein
MKKSLMRALEEGAKLVSPPLPDTAFNGRCVAFLFYSPLGLFEFVEDLPATETSNSNILHEIPALGIPSARVCEDSGTYLGLDATGDLDRQLREVFRGVFPSLDEAAITSAAFNTTSEWDSLMHLQLICQVEMDFGVNIPSDVVGTLTSFEIMLEMLHNLLLKR